jgi:hypothetical protein
VAGPDGLAAPRNTGVAWRFGTVQSGAVDSQSINQSGCGFKVFIVPQDQDESTGYNNIVGAMRITYRIGQNPAWHGLGLVRVSNAPCGEAPAEVGVPPQPAPSRSRRYSNIIPALASILPSTGSADLRCPRPKWRHSMSRKALAARTGDTSRIMFRQPVQHVTVWQSSKPSGVKYGARSSTVVPVVLSFSVKCQCQCQCLYPLFKPTLSHIS